MRPGDMHEDEEWPPRSAIPDFPDYRIDLAKRWGPWVALAVVIVIAIFWRAF